jgi:hypothetical protein
VQRSAESLREEARRTYIRILVDFHKVLDTGPGNSIPDRFAGTIRRLREENIRIVVCSFVGWTSQDRADSAREQLESFCQRCFPTRNREEVLENIVFTNHRVGLPYYCKRNQQWSTGGKDHTAQRLHAPVLIDDCAGTCEALEAIGGFSYRVRTYWDRHPGKSSFEDFDEAVTSLIAWLRRDTNRQVLIDAARSLREPASDAPWRFDDRMRR